MILPIKIIDKMLLKSDYYPKYEKPGDHGIDLRACIQSPITLMPGESAKIPVGFAIDMHKKLTPLSPGDNWGLGGLVIPKSGLGTRGLVVGNLVGLVDEGYQGEIQVTAWNRLDVSQPGTWREQARIEIVPMMRFAQLFFVPIIRATFLPVEDFSHTTERGAGGFGHTGTD